MYRRVYKKRGAAARPPIYYFCFPVVVLKNRPCHRYGPLWFPSHLEYFARLFLWDVLKLYERFLRLVHKQILITDDYSATFV